MVLSIRHQMHYLYTRPVFLEPLTIRLTPRSDVTQKLRNFKLTIHPEPAGISETLDIDGNSAVLAWFDGAHDKLTIKTKATVETLRQNPFDFILTDAAAQRIPLHYTGSLATALAHYTDQSEVTPEVEAFAKNVAQRVEHQTSAFLFELTQEIQHEFKWTIRDKGDSQPSEITLVKRRGACRDLAVLFIDCCRVMGLAARFVSGYFQGAGEQSRHLHAWAEVYLPGGGWRGYDPTHGMAVEDHYVALAASAHPALSAPTFGTFRGSKTESRFRHEVAIKVLNN